MEDERTSWGATLSVPLWGLVVTAATTLALFPIASDHSFLPTGMVGAALTVLIGVLARSARATRPYTVPLQVAAWLVWATALIAPDTVWLGIVPTRATLDALLADIDRVVALSAEQAAPLSYSPALSGLIALAVATLGLLVDVLAMTARRASLVGLLLLGIYMVPVAALSGQVSMHAFWPGAVAWIGLLLASERNDMRRWGSVGTAGDDAQYGGEHPARQLDVLGRQVGLGAVGVALVLPLLLPSAPLQLFGTGGTLGIGGGPDSSVISVNNPVLDLRRNLALQSDVELLDVRTDDPAPAYLRTSVLDEFTGEQWQPSSRDESNGVDADDDLPAAPGVDSEVAGRDVSYEVTVSEDFSSSWLPVVYAATSVDVDGDWRVDRDTLDVVVADQEEQLTSTSYAFTARLTEPTPEQLRAAPGAPESLDDLTQLPDDLPQVIHDQAQSVAGDADTSYDAALALESWFRTEGDFVYSTDSAAGTGSSTISSFVSDDRVGYCEQFASAMALMARSVDIPARVAVGFLRPDEKGPQRYVFTGRDLHAWPELYFEGAGWVRFEPTPADRTGAGNVGGNQSPADEAPANRIPDERQNVPGSQAGEDQAPTATDNSGGSVPPWVAEAVAVSLPVLLLAGFPAGYRAYRRRSRWSSAASDFGEVAEVAWTELGDGVLDLHRPWDRSITPRAAGRSLRPFVAPDAAGLEALDRLVHVVERSRFAADTPERQPTVESTRADVERTLQAVADGCSRTQLVRALCWPRSVWLSFRGALRPPALPWARVRHS
jgi:transglutaminase-like putative cysteine protease